MENESGHAALNARKWNKRAETYDEQRFSYFRWMQRKAVSFLSLKKGIHFLDIGCGTGYAVRFVANMLETDGAFFGVDISPRMVDIARANAAGFKNTSFVVANAEELPFDGEIFEVILCTNSFHHYQNPSKALSEIYRVMKPNGQLYVMDVTADSRLIRRIDQRVKRREAEHVKFYATTEYHSLFEKAGLKHISSRLIWPPEKLHIAQKVG
jgi:ubiquinone/menaquinone biosynthesis C-methylase UbiE